MSLGAHEDLPGNISDLLPIGAHEDVSEKPSGSLPLGAHEVVSAALIDLLPLDIHEDIFEVVCDLLSLDVHKDVSGDLDEGDDERAQGHTAKMMHDDPASCLANCARQRLLISATETPTTYRQLKKIFSIHITRVVPLFYSVYPITSHLLCWASG